MNNEKWDEICFYLSENIRNYISENQFEQNVIQALIALGWKQHLGDFEIRPSFQLGAANRITPDFVIKSSDSRKLFVIEIKQPSIPITSIFQQQLFSYMRQLKLEYGILIGQTIQIFYDGVLVEQEDPILLETIRFEKNSAKGEKFVQLFSKENFNTELLKEFTLNAIKKLNRKEERKKLKSEILSDNYKYKLIELIKQDFISEYDGELIDVVLTELDIEIIDKSITKPKPEESLQSEFDEGKDYTKYNFNNQSYAKNRLVLAVVKEYVLSHPNTSYGKLSEVFPKNIQGSIGVFNRYEDVQKKYEGKSKRHFTKPDERIQLSDCVIAVCTQWGSPNVNNFIEQAKSLGYTINTMK
jgi:hypothetical protein